ncbi:hypothetical protein PR048_000658 [Dryococelus australis]|uniref:Uncharacterized protein n=1 Tax=Dryococelus australis TaxID=614101 RepID=A0ABQ9IF99_9NEOP|nr:hypothetical protein PR048_000658 [Dryococelus australis]
MYENYDVKLGGFSVRSSVEYSLLQYDRGRDGVVVRLPASHQGEPGSIPGGVAPGFSHVEILLDGVAGRRVFSGISRPSRPCTPAQLQTRLTPPPRSAAETTLLSTAQSSRHSITHHSLIRLLSARQDLISGRIYFLPPVNFKSESGKAGITITRQSGKTAPTRTNIFHQSIRSKVTPTNAAPTKPPRLLVFGENFDRVPIAKLILHGRANKRLPLTQLPPDFIKPSLLAAPPPLSYHSQSSPTPTRTQFDCAGFSVLRSSSWRVDAPQHDPKAAVHKSRVGGNGTSSGDSCLRGSPATGWRQPLLRFPARIKYAPRPIDVAGYAEEANMLKRTCGAKDHLSPEGRVGFYCVSGLTPDAYKEGIMQGITYRGKEGLDSHGLHFGAMNTSLSELRSSINYEEQGENRDRVFGNMPLVSRVGKASREETWSLLFCNMMPAVTREVFGRLSGDGSCAIGPLPPDLFCEPEN